MAPLDALNQSMLHELVKRLAAETLGIDFLRCPCVALQLFKAFFSLAAAHILVVGGVVLCVVFAHFLFEIGSGDDFNIFLKINGELIISVWYFAAVRERRGPVA